MRFTLTVLGVVLLGCSSTVTPLATDAAVDHSPVDVPEGVDAEPPADLPVDASAPDIVDVPPVPLQPAPPVVTGIPCTRGGACVVGVGRCARPGRVVCGESEVRAFNLGQPSCVVTASGRTRCIEPLGTRFVTLGLDDVVEVDAYVQVCARRVGGRLTCWGGLPNFLGGTGDTVYRPRPDPAFTVLTEVAQVSTSFGFTCAVRVDRTVWCWGMNNAGQLGDGTTTDRVAPVRVLGMTEVAEVRLSTDVACARRTDGTVWCWGIGWQIGAGSSAWSMAPMQTQITEVRAITRGGRHACALRADGSVWCWGDSNVGQFGNGTYSDSSQYGFAPVRAHLDTPQVEIGAGDHFVCARDAGGRVTCWGSNSYGQLGSGPIEPRRPLPTIVTGLDDATELRVGRMGACVRRRRGGIWCWGSTFGANFTFRDADRSLHRFTGYEENGETCAGTPGDPVAETCNGMDDDCDGLVDNLATGTCP